MNKESFRFIHAGDFHLERPLQDILDLPDHLKAAMVEAPWKAAEAVFEHAAIENVDFVLLCGDLLNPMSTGPQGISFLLDQFESLRSRGIQVYWAAGQVDDADRWPEAVPLPTNVHLFSKRQVEELTFRRHGISLVSILGRSSDGRESIRAVEYGHEPDNVFTIAVGHGDADVETLAGERVEYWALGGKHQPTILQNEVPCVRYCGTPQSRCMSEPGAHGFYLVDVNADESVQVHSVEVDLFRYSVQEIDAADMALGRDLRQLLSKRVSKLQAESAGRHLLVRWKIHLDLEQAGMVGPAAIDETLNWLRREFGHGKPSLWTTEIDLIPPRQLPKKWYDEDTILGDFLRVAQQHPKTAGKELSIKEVIDAETPASPTWQAALVGSGTSADAQVLERATLLGVDLLRGHSVDLTATTRRFGGNLQANQ